MSKPKAKKDNSDILRDTIETLEITIRAARRCAYDLVHCSNDYGLIMSNAGCPKDEMVKLYQDRARHYVKLFQSGNSMKDYRIKLHTDLDDAHDTIEKLRAILAEHKIDDPTLF